MELQLICHGMMLFWYRLPSQDGAKDDGYRILLPQAPVHRDDDGGHDHDHGMHMDMGADHMMQHQIRLGATIGADPSVLLYPDPPEPTRFFSLDFSCKESPKVRGKKSGVDDLMFFRVHGGVQAIPDIGIDQPGGIAFVIDIPYPLREEPVRVADYKQNPYQKGRTVQDFGVNLKRVVGTRVFSFEIDDPAKDIALQNQADPADRRIIHTGPLEDSVKVHLYSQPRITPPAGFNHLPTFNAMLRVANKPLDLKLNPQRLPTIDPAGWVFPDGITFLESRHLEELTGGGAQGMDPAGCNQGGGC